MTASQSNTNLGPLAWSEIIIVPFLDTVVETQQKKSMVNGFYTTLNPSKWKVELL